MTVINAKYVNWHNENLQEFYEDDNEGFIHGVTVFNSKYLNHELDSTNIYECINF